ncbi:MAG: hypothetical protein WC979_02440 [Candidatus Pacearchaeota archaeon]|jgi:hypothetical protein|nr:hypothetical protein [Clostridia bacterium]
MKLPRKLKKKYIKCLGRGTYQGIMNGYLTIERYNKNRGIITKYANIELAYPLIAYQYNPYYSLKLPKTIKD